MHDQPSLARKFLGASEGITAWAFYGLFKLLPTRWCSALGAMLERFHGAEKQQISLRIRECLSWLTPSISRADQSKLTRDILQNTGRSYAETMIVDRLLSNSRVDTDLPEHVRIHLSNGKPMILVTVHLANLGDMIIASLADLLFRRYGYEVGGSPTRKIDNPWLSDLAQHIRNRYLAGINGRGYDPTLKTARDFYRFLMKPRSVILLHLDEAYDRQVHFPTFGRPIDQRGNLIKSIKLAAATGALIQPVYLKRVSQEPRFKMSWLPAFHVESNGAALNKVALKRYAQELNELFEPRVFENLADWAQICYLRPPQQTN